MYLAQTVEAGPDEAVFQTPRHPLRAACSTPSPIPSGRTTWAHGAGGKCLRPSIPRQLGFRNEPQPARGDPSLRGIVKR